MDFNIINRKLFEQDFNTKQTEDTDVLQVKAVVEIPDICFLRE